MSDFTKLIERLEACVGPDRALDLELHIAASPERYPEKWSWDDELRPPHLTGSMDHAIALVTEKLPGWSWLVRDDDEGAFCNLSIPALRGNPSGEWIDGETCFPEWSKTAPVAVCLSLFKALAAQEKASD